MKLAQKIALGFIRKKFSVLSIISKKAAARSAFNFFRTPHERTTGNTPKIFDKAEQLQVDLQGTTTNGYRWNHPKERRVLIVHGFESAVMNFGPYVEVLIGRGFEVLAFDAPAHGISKGKTITAPQFAEMIVSINKNFGPVQSYVTHSFGGLAVMLALEEMPHDDSYKVAMIAPLTEMTTSVDLFFRFMKLDDGVRAEFDQLIVRLGGRPIGWYSIHRAIHHFKGNILWIHDEGDEQTPLADALKVKDEHLPRVRFEITTGLGHSRIYREPQIVQLVADFL